MDKFSQAFEADTGKILNIVINADQYVETTYKTQLTKCIKYLFKKYFFIKNTSFQVS